jgi:hypothetical protein
VTLGNKALAAGDITLAARAGGGRKAVLAALSGGTVTGSGDADCFAIVDTGNTRILTTGTMTLQNVTNGNTFSTSAIDIGMAQPT